MITTITLNPAIDATWFLDTFDEEEINRLQGKKIDAGGKGINISRFLTMMGCPTLAMGFCGGDNGARLSSLLDEAGVRHNLTPIQGETRQNMTVFVEEGKKTIKINEAGPEISPAECEAFEKALTEQAKQGGFIVLAGKNPPGIDGKTTIDLLSRAKAAGAKVVVDSESLTLEEVIALGPTLIKPNELEFSKMLGRPLETDKALIQAAREVVAKGVEYVVISMGGDGLLGISADKAYKVEVPKIAVRSTVGAGDSVVAGTLMALSSGEPFEKAICMGAAFGSAMASTDGTEIPPKALVEEIHSKITCHSVDA
jgi:1-phosphofructokinase family hexose kinase